MYDFASTVLQMCDEKATDRNQSLLDCSQLVNNESIVYPQSSSILSVVELSGCKNAPCTDRA